MAGELPASRATRRGEELWQRLKAVLPDTERHPHLGHWLQLDPDKFERVLDHVEHEVKDAERGDRPPIEDVGAFFSYTWNEFKGESDARSKGPSK
jgi:hypothetical protein